MTAVHVDAGRILALALRACLPVGFALSAGACASMPPAAPCDRVFQGSAEAFAAGAHRIGGAVRDPTLVEQTALAYTRAAREQKIEGVVELEAIIEEDGSVGAVRILKSLDSQFGLDGEAVCAVKGWRFKPGMLDGVPVRVVVTLILEFRLH